MRTLLGKLRRSENCPERKVEVFIGLWGTLSVNFLSITEAWVPGTNNSQAGGRRRQGAGRAVCREHHL